jgi:PleD family two-component response regulator
VSIPAPWLSNTREVEYLRQVEQASFLIVDDFDTMRRITINQLRQLGAKKMLEAANGAEALRILSSEHVDIIISDWNMPVMSGLQLLLTVRANARVASIPFMMITAEAERERVQQAVDAGVSELLVKPYSAGLFADRLQRAFSRVPRPAASEPAAAPPASAAPSAGVAAAAFVPAAAPLVSAPLVAITPVQLPPAAAPVRPTILVVDDTPDNLHLLSTLFKDAYRVKIAHHGEKALAICHSDEPPDLVLLDIMMPGLDGFEVAAQLRSHPSSEHIPIIFVTALTDEASRLRGMELGAVDFVTKPIEPEALRLRTRNFMRYISLQRETQANYDAMMEVARMKEEVERITRHDLKGALAAVIGLVQAIADGESLAAEQLEQALLAEQAALKALHMINLSAEIYKIESGRFQLQAQPVQISHVLGQLVAQTRQAFGGKGLQITLAQSAGNTVAAGDPMFCYSIFQNLLKNACEAAPFDSQVSITVNGGEQLSVAISNSGVVPAAIRARFFDKYATAGKPDGTGLGTYSARLLTEAQGGAIAMQTDDATNTTVVTVTLPVNSKQTV